MALEVPAGSWLSGAALVHLSRRPSSSRVLRSSSPLTQPLPEQECLLFHTSRDAVAPPVQICGVLQGEVCAAQLCLA